MDLPEPVCPTIAVVVPARTVNDTSNSTCRVGLLSAPPSTTTDMGVAAAEGSLGVTAMEGNFGVAKPVPLAPAGLHGRQMTGRHQQVAPQGVAASDRAPGVGRSLFFSSWMMVFCMESAQATVLNAFGNGRVPVRAHHGVGERHVPELHSGARRIGQLQQRGQRQQHWWHMEREARNASNALWQMRTLRGGALGASTTSGFSLPVHERKHAWDDSTRDGWTGDAHARARTGSGGRKGWIRPSTPPQSWSTGNPAKSVAQTPGLRTC